LTALDVAWIAAQILKRLRDRKGDNDAEGWREEMQMMIRSGQVRSIVQVQYSAVHTHQNWPPSWNVHSTSKALIDLAWLGTRRHEI
jgi:hypothetical protein